VVAVCEFLGVVECEDFLLRELIFVGIELSNFCLGQLGCFSFCNLQKPSIQSGKAIVEPCDLEPNQFNERLIKAMALPCGEVKGEVALKEFWCICETSGQRGILASSLHGSNLRECLWWQLLIWNKSNPRHERAPFVWSVRVGSALS
jgi:hypothetical protein